MLGWWRNWRQQAAANKATLAINDNLEFRASQVPELIGLSQVEAMAYILKQIKLWNESCTPLQSTELSSRLMASAESWKQQGLTMP